MNRSIGNKYDVFIIILIGSGCFGGLFAPLTIQRLVALILTPWLLSNLKKYNSRIPKFVSIFFIIWLFSSVLSLFWSEDKENGIKYIIYNLCSIINFYSLYILSLKSYRPVKSICLGWIILFLGTLPIALWEINSGFHLSISLQDENATVLNSEGVKVVRTFASVTFGNLNNYVLTCLYCLPFVLLSLIIQKKAISLITLAGIIFVIFVNSSRGGLLCLGLAIVIALYYINKYSIIKKTVVFAVIVVFVGVIIANAGFLLNQIMGRLLENSMTSDESRMEIYTRGIHIFFSYLTLGCGIGSLELNLDRLNPGNIAAMHNVFLEFMVQYGLVPFILFIIFFYKILSPLITSKKYSFRFIGILNIVILIPMNIINSGYLTNSIFWLFWASLFFFSQLSKKSIE